MALGTAELYLIQDHIPCVTDGKTLHYRYKSGYTDVGSGPMSHILVVVWDEVLMSIIGVKMLLINQATWINDSISLSDGGTLIQVSVKVSVYNRDQYCDLDDIRIA